MVVLFGHAMVNDPPQPVNPRGWINLFVFDLFGCCLPSYFPVEKDDDVRTILSLVRLGELCQSRVPQYTLYVIQTPWFALAVGESTVLQYEYNTVRNSQYMETYPDRKWIWDTVRSNLHHWPRWHLAQQQHNDTQLSYMAWSAEKKKKKQHKDIII